VFANDPELLGKEMMTEEEAIGGSCGGLALQEADAAIVKSDAAIVATEAPAAFPLATDAERWSDIPSDGAGLQGRVVAVMVGIARGAAILNADAAILKVDAAILKVDSGIVDCGASSPFAIVACGDRGAGVITLACAGALRFSCRVGPAWWSSALRQSLVAGAARACGAQGLGALGHSYLPWLGPFGWQTWCLGHCWLE
jgi:hypothetical protein